MYFFTTMHKEVSSSLDIVEVPVIFGKDAGLHPIVILPSQTVSGFQLVEQLY